MPAYRRQIRKSAHKKGLWTPPPHSVAPRERCREQRFVPRWVLNVNTYQEHEIGERQRPFVVVNAIIAAQEAKAKAKARKHQAA